MSLTHSTHSVSLLKNLEKLPKTRMLFDADVFAAVAVVVVNDRSTYELRAGEDGNKERGALLSFLSSCFLFYFVDVPVLRDRVRMRRNDWGLKITALKERQKHFLN